MYGIRLFLKVLALPPASLFLLGFVGLWVRRRRPRLGRVLIGLAVGGLYLLSTPAVSLMLVRTLETEPALSPQDVPAAEAIVILSGDTMETPEYGGRTVGEQTFERLRYGAWLHRRLGLPVLVTGGTLREGKSAIAGLMRDALEQELATPVHWVENGSRNTWENARNTATILRKEGVRQILLVTHAWHMPRSRLSFEAFGFEVVPAPTAFADPLETGPAIVLPSAYALRSSAAALHEWLGRAVYLLWYAPRAA